MLRILSFGILVGLEANVHVEDPGAFTTPWDAIQRFRQYEAAECARFPSSALRSWRVRRKAHSWR